jgi:hypothetical protein
MIGKIGSGFKFHTKSLFWSPIFFSLQMINFDIKVYFPHFSVFFFFVRGKIENCWFRWRERKWSLITIPTTKKVEIGVNGFHFRRGASPMCFFFFLPKKVDLTAWMFWIQVDFGLLSYFLTFLKSWIYLLRYLRFSKYFWSKISWK